jgi:Domain of unknown function (DUF5916)
MGRVGCLAIALWALGSIWPVSAATAGQQSPSADSTSSESASASPVAPAVIARTPEGQATVRAVRVTRPPTLDGRLDDSVYTGTLPIDGFIQQEPQEGAPATEKTEAWILFDDTNIYVAARCWDSHPERAVLSELRRDNNNIVQNENFTVVFDTFHDRRNGFFFQTNALGAVRDQTIVDDALNTSWNGVWDVRVARFEAGWTLEMVIPFKTLRYLGAGPQIWGVNFRRIVKWKNEYSYLTAMPASFGTGNGIGRMGSAGTLVGLETPGSSKNLEIKPYAVSSLTTDHTARPAFENDPNGDVGLDFKYGLTRSLIADVTVNTDFAQVEEDLQQVNLTRFSLFFPEKRDFFLEGQGIFSFGGVSFNNGGGSPGDVPIMFFSRRIGLENGQSVPVIAGGRLTGRAGRYTLGAVNIGTDDKLSAAAVQTNFTAVRVKRDVLRRSNVGLVATMRSPSEGIRNALIGADTNLFLFENVSANLYFAKTDTPGLHGGTESYRGKIDLSRDRYGMTAEHLVVGEHFDPQVGYARRTDFRRTAAEARFTPRPRRATLVRKYTYAAGIDYVTDASVTELQNREVAGTFQIDFQNSDQLAVDASRTYELIPRAFVISPGVVVPAGSYDYQNLRVLYNLGQQRRVSGRVTTAHGSFYDGTKTDLIYTGRVTILPQLAVEPGMTINWVDLPFGEFTSRLLNARVIVTPTPRMVVSSLIQYNALPHSLSSSVRLRWEYRPGSELFVVYSDGRNTLPTPTSPGLQNRTFAVKITRLLRF